MTEQMNRPEIYHGGALDIAIDKYGGAISQWLDLSTGINPYSYPFDMPSPEAWAQLPQKSALDELLVAASVAYECAPKYILASNGSQALIELLPQVIARSTIAIMSPTYEEHAKCWRQYGHKVILVTSLDEAKKADNLIIVNPNNPTGKLFGMDELQQLQKHFAVKNGYLIIDEAFIDVANEHSLSQFAGQDGLIVIRSLGKFFGLAGARVGFVLTDTKTRNKIAKKIGLWSVSGMALQVAKQALNDLAWQKKMRQTLAGEMKIIHDILCKNGFEIIGSTNLFCLAKIPKGKCSASDFFENFAQKHILVRKFEKDDNILRFGLPDKRDIAKFLLLVQQTCVELKI